MPERGVGCRLQTYFPSALVCTMEVCPVLKRLPHVLHSVLGPLGPGALPAVSVSSLAHQSQRQLPPLHPRRCEPSPRMVSNFALHASHR